MAQYVYTMNRVGKVVPPKRTILKNISLSFFPGAKIGVLGLNGSGKSSLLRIMAGEDKDIEGEAIPMPGIKRRLPAAGAAARPDSDRQREAVEQGLGEVMEAKEKLDAIYAAYAEPDADFDKLAADQAQVRGDHCRGRLRQHDHQLEIAADALRLPPWDATIATLSGGEKRRVALCRLLLSKPDMLLLDEPTNHLDAESVDWLEQFLAKFPGTVVAVTHDRYFLDNAAEWILELDRGQGIPWKGNYSSWLEQKDARLQTGGVDRVGRARRRSRRSSSGCGRTPRAARRKARPALARFEELSSHEYQKRNETQRDLHPGRRAPRRFGDRVQGRQQGLRRTAADRRPELQDPARRDRRHHRTERRRQVDAVPDDHRQGEARQRRGRDRADGQAGPCRPVARLACWRQDGMGGRSRTALDLLKVGKFEMPSRAYVGRFNFKGRTSRSGSGNLSGGERGRLHLAKTLVEGGNVLLLDEPSNDLDVETLRALEDALLEFAGCVLVISHDRWFLDRIATHILAFEGDSQVGRSSPATISEYEEDKKKRLGEEAARPHRIRYKPLKV